MNATAKQLSTPTLGTIEATDLYLDLITNCLTRLSFPERYQSIPRPRGAAWRRAVWAGVYRPVATLLNAFHLALVVKRPANIQLRTLGQDWPEDAETMIGLKRLQNLRYCVTAVLEDGVPGDFIETGVWRGGASILMRAILKVYGDTTRRVWLADSFQGLPKPDEERHAADKGSEFWRYKDRLAVSLEQVKANFERYGLLDDSVCFLVGWFRDTLPKAPIDRLAILRLDGDMYESTLDGLVNLYDKVSPGGFIIVDDYSIAECRRAVTDFRSERGIEDEIVPIDGTGAFWRKL